MQKHLAIGSAAGFSGDRTDAARPLVDTLLGLGTPAALVYETLAERTLALAHLARRKNPEQGYEPLLARMTGPVLADCVAHRIPIVGNFGAANPMAAARLLRDMARQQGLRTPRIAVVEGDDFSAPSALQSLAQWLPDGLDLQRLVCANAYIGAASIADALREEADIVVCGRIADPALVLGPALAHFNWALDDWDRLARATIAGHLLECGAQVTGGYFADPGYKDVPGLAHVGYPLCEIDADGGFVISKAANSGGVVDLRTVKEQLLYEMHDPAAYLTPDVVADISQCEVVQEGPDRVRVRGVRGHARPGTLKVNLFSEGGWLAEGEISYAGPRAAARASLAGEILRERLPQLALRLDLIGVCSVFGDDDGRMLAAMEGSPTWQAARDVRLRVSGATDSEEAAQSLLHEVNALYTCGPAGGGGVRTGMRTRLNALSCLVPRELVRVTHRFLEDA